jgi:hypothetical protein
MKGERTIFPIVRLTIGKDGLTVKEIVIWQLHAAKVVAICWLLR